MKYLVVAAASLFLTLDWTLLVELRAGSGDGLPGAGVILSNRPGAMPGRWLDSIDRSTGGNQSTDIPTVPPFACGLSTMNRRSPINVRPPQRSSVQITNT